MLTIGQIPGTNKNMASLLDVTDRKQAEATVRVSEGRYKAIFENSRDAIYITASDGTYIDANNAALDLFGYTREEMKKVNAGQLYADPADARRFLKEIGEKGFVQDFAVRLRKKDGTEMDCLFTVTAQRGDDGGILEYQGIIRDITDRKRVEKKLREGEERYRTLVDNINLGVNLIDADHTIVMVNTAGSKQIDKPVSELIGKKCFQEFEKRDAVCPHCPGVRTMASGKPAEVETEGVRDDGSRYNVRIQTFPVYGDDDTVTGFIEISEDITERKHAEELLQRERETFSTILENALYGVALMGRDGEYFYLNPAFTAIMGYTLEEIPTSRDLMHKAYPDKEYRKKIIELWNKDGEFERAEREVSVVCKDGKIKEIEFGRAQLPDGRAVLMLADITERKRMEEELRTSRMHLADAMDMACIAYWEADHQAKQFILNDAFYDLYGTTAEAEGGYRMPFEKFVRRFIHPDDMAVFGQVTEDIEKNTDQEQILYHEHRIIRRNGEIRYIGVRIRVFRDASGNIIRTFGANQDITERKKAEERLQRYAAEMERSNEEVKNFAYIVSHDLRVPLVNLKGYISELRSALEMIGPNIETALSHLDEDKRSAVAMALHEDVPEALEFVTTSVSRMDSFINAVLLLSRLGRRDLKPEPIDMNALVQETLGTLSHQIEERGITVAVEPLPEVVADRTAMEQIMGNILGNAVKYLDASRPGQIKVFAKVNGSATIFSIRDNGRGIAQKDMDKVFATFRRAGKQDTPGEGMGLAYVQTLVRRHNGRIWCESELGKGTTFTFTIATPSAQGAHNV